MDMYSLFKGKQFKDKLLSDKQIGPTKPELTRAKEPGRKHKQKKPLAITEPARGQAQSYRSLSREPGPLLPVSPRTVESPTKRTTTPETPWPKPRNSPITVWTRIQKNPCNKLEIKRAKQLIDKDPASHGLHRKNKKDIDQTEGTT